VLCLHAGRRPEQKLDPQCVFPSWAELRVQPFPASIVSLFGGKGREAVCMCVFVYMCVALEGNEVLLRPVGSRR